VLKAQRVGVEGAGALKVCDVDADVSGDECHECGAFLYNCRQQLLTVIGLNS
jgi:hypothetical protein